MSHHVRVRFAPSPTGEPHVGNIRTAIFNWLFARSQGGKFILRIEDTDLARKEEGALEAILDSLRWLGLDWDEGPGVGGPYVPYVQSERLHHYQEAARRLVDQGSAYRCYCSPQRLEEMRKEQMRNRRPPGYDRRCRFLTEGDSRRLQSEGITPVVRFAVPMEGRAVFHDLVRGDVAFDLSLLDDFVLLKSDGFPTYHLASVVDDYLMKITHVMRAEEWLASAPRHQELYRALGYPMPDFAHLPMILGPDRSKLSKRHGATSVLEYRRLGYLPDAMLNFLALLGWSLDDHTEVIPREELVRHFSLERVNQPAAIFNLEKLTWLNGVYIRQLSPKALADALLPFLERPVDCEYLLRIVPLVQERLKLLGEGAELTSFFFADGLEYEPQLLVQRGADGKTCLGALEVAKERLAPAGSWDAATLEGVLRPMAEELGMKTGTLFGCIRVAVTGRTATPPLFQTMEVLGRERCLARLDMAIQKLHALP